LGKKAPQFSYHRRADEHITDAILPQKQHAAQRRVSDDVLRF